MSSTSTVSPLAILLFESCAFSDDESPYFDYNLDADVATMSSPQQSSSSSATFYRDELRRALDEQKFGITSFKIGSSSALEASARVTLLEGDEITILISIRGYQVIHPIASKNKVPSIDTKAFQAIHSTASGDDDASADPKAFENIEALLQSESALYSVKRTEVLFAKLGG